MADETSAAGSRSTARSTTSSSCARARSARPSLPHAQRHRGARAPDRGEGRGAHASAARDVRARAPGTRASAPAAAGPRPDRQETALLVSGRARPVLRVRDQGASGAAELPARDRSATRWISTCVRGVPGTRTIFTGIHRLPPASTLTWSAGAMPRSRRYWSATGAARRR